MKPGPQSHTFHASRGFPRRPDRVNGWLVALGIVLMCASAIGAAAAIAVQAMHPK